MSLMDSIDDALLGADDDELDYDLEKDEEDALLADDNYEDTYDDTPGDDTQDEPSQIEEDILDIDSNVRLDETEEDFGEPISKENTSETLLKIEQDDEEEIEEQKERNRFMNERIVAQRSKPNNIPDTLEKVAVQPVPHTTHRNQKFQRNNRGRGRGRQNQNQNHNRGSVFGRVGNPPTEGKTVLINPHFRGNVQVSENARLVWDPNFHSGFAPQQQRYAGPQMAQVAPFQNHPSPWANPYTDPNSFSQHQNVQPNFQEPPPQVHYNQQDMIRPLIQVNTQQSPFVPQQPPPQQQMPNWSDDQNYCEMFSQGNFRGPNPRYMNQQGISPIMVNNPPPQNYNQQTNYPSRTFNFPENQNRPFVNPNHPNASPLVNIPQTYPPPQNNFDQPPPPFQQQPHFPQNRPPVYEQYNQSDQNQYQSQFSAPMQNNPNFQGGSYQPPANYEPNFIPNQSNQEPFPQKTYNHQYNQNRQNNHQRHQNQYNRSPGKRRSFENANSGDQRKKKRSMEFSNLHEVPTVEMPDTTTEEKEEEDEETKNYRLKIEEQKKLREKILREKEERRKAAAAQKESENKPVPSANLITTLKTTPKPLIQQQPQQIQQIQPNRPQNATRNLQQKTTQQQRQLMQQRKFQSQNIQVQTIQTNPGRVQQVQQRRVQQPAQNIATQVQQRIVVMNNQQQKQQQLKQNLTRRVVLKGMNTVVEPSQSEQTKPGGETENLSSFLSNRKVISSSSEALNPTMVDTPVVVVSNLAAGTSDIKIRKLCQGLGPIQNIQMNSVQRQATIRFKNIVSAHKFFKKYQRKIVDLSMIQVSLLPES